MSSKLSDETKQILNCYFDAATNLYGIISLRKLLEIYNMQKKSETFVEEEKNNNDIEDNNVVNVLNN